MAPFVVWDSSVLKSVWGTQGAGGEGGSPFLKNVKKGDRGPVAGAAAGMGKVGSDYTFPNFDQVSIKF